MAHISRHLGLDESALLGKSDLKPSAPFRLKTSQGTTAADVRVAACMATQIARLAALAAPVAASPATASDPGRGSPDPARAIRDSILDAGNPWVSLASLLDYCWSRGVPVLHASAFPKGMRRMHGLAARCGSSSAIVLCRQQRHPAWFLFDLAHELGHVTLGHLKDDGALVDAEIRPEFEADAAVAPDDEEKQANAFAVALLWGRRGVRVLAQGRWPNAGSLARQAEQIGRENRVDPGHVVLNYAKSMGKQFWPVAMAALAELDAQADGPALIRERVAALLDWSQLPEDSAEYITRMTGATAPDGDELLLG